MSVEDWKTLFTSFAHDTLKARKDDADDEYRRALVACEAILSEKETDNSFFVQAWKPDYGAAIITSEDIHDQLMLKVNVVGLDGWTFTIDAAGNDNATCEGEPAFLLVGDVPRDKMVIFLDEVNHKLSLAEASKRGNDRHASNPDGGIQHTPGFLRSKCIEVLCSSRDKIFEKENPPKITPQCSGFTDVGLHTGCNPRETSLPLIQAVLKVTLKFGINPELTSALHCYARFMAEYYLSLAGELKEKLHQENCSKEDIKESMHCLTVVSRYASQLSKDQRWPDAVATITEKCQDIRKHLEKVSSEQAFNDSKQFVVHLPDLTVIEEASSPIFSSKSELEKPDRNVSLAKIYEVSKFNLDWLPFKVINTLADCKKLLEDTRLSKNDAYTFSIVFVSIEVFLLKLAKDHLSPSALSSMGLDPKLLVHVCNKYNERLEGFINGGSTGGLLSNELFSHQVLIRWLKFCLLFKIACIKYSLISRFSVPLKYGDLEHLVLKDKWAWELLDLICIFLYRHRNNRNVAVFSGREDEIDGMLALADQFVTRYSKYEGLWVEEQNEASLRVRERWNDIKKKKETCEEIRESIKQLMQKIDDYTRQRDGTQRYIKHSYYSNGQYKTREALNPEWNTLNKTVISLQKSVQVEGEKLIEAQKAPEFLKQPLPVDEKLGKRALFFIHMPSLLRYTWQASFEAQEIVFTDGKPMKPNGHNFHSYYKGPFPYREEKEVTETPLALYIAGPPEHYGTENVEDIHDKNDGVWYPSGFSPSMVWISGQKPDNTSRCTVAEYFSETVGAIESNVIQQDTETERGQNPFDAPRCTAVEHFSEPISDERLKWTVIQQGSETPDDRGNMALSKLYQKPLTMTREQFLSLGNLRAQPLLQLFHLLDSIKAQSLPFDEKSIHTTHALVRQVLYHIGEISEIPDREVLVKLWKAGVEPWDQSFMETYRRVLSDALDRLKEASKNENELLVYIEIISFFSQFDSRFTELIDQCSDVALGWAERMESEIQKVHNESQGEKILKKQMKQHLFLLYALVSYEMILPEYVNEKRRMNRIIELMLRISSALPQQLGERATHLMHRAYFFMARILSPFCEQRASFSYLLTVAVKKTFSSYVDDENIMWTTFERSFCWWTKNRSGDYLCINIMNGKFLVNGSPPSKLPVSIKTHPLFCRVFGEIDFEVTVGIDGAHKTLKPFTERYYSFFLNGDELLIEEEFNNEKLLLLDNNASSTWGNHIPKGMIQLYSHWQSEDRMVVFFRPIPFQKRSVYYILTCDGLYKVPYEDREGSSKSVEKVVRSVSFYDKYLVLDTKAKADIAVFEKFDHPDYIHPYLTHEKVFKVLLSRYRISFEFKPGATSYDCPEFGEYKLSLMQQFSDMLYGFYEYLVLEKGSAGVTVIFPQGSVVESNGRVYIERPTPAEIDDISPTAYSVNTFSVHPKFRFLQATNVLSGLQLASIQAATSSNLPEQGTQMTGYEMAIQQIRKCWVNRPLNGDEQLMLQSLLALKHLPSTLIILSQQLAKSSFQLSFLYQAPFPMTDLNMNDFIDAVNENNLPLQYDLQARNYRLSLTQTEMRSSLGINKSTQHFNAIINGAKSEMSYENVKAEVDSFERQLCGFTSELTNERNFEFPLKNLPSFNFSEIGSQMVSQLKDSHKTFVKSPKLNLSTEDEIVLQKISDMHHSVIAKKEKLYMLLRKRIVDEVNCCTSGETNLFLICKAANAIPVLTLCDLVQASWQPYILRHFNPMLTENDINELFLMIIDWMQFSVLDDKICRIKKYLLSCSTDLALQELQVQRKYNPYDYPQWLAFEYDQGLQIRSDQIYIISEALKLNGSIAQLNMGLGKTKVIVPCLLLEWSRRKYIPRVYLLSNLLDEGFDYLHQTLTGGVFNKKLFRFPFSRDVQLSIKQASVLIASIKYCQIEEGAIILAPEHSLSLLLKGFELDHSSETCEIEVATKIREADKFPFADIFDEVDETMCPNQELIYAEGSPIALESGPRRWGAIFSLLFHLRHHPSLLSYFRIHKVADFEHDNCQLDEFNRFRLLPGKRLEKELLSIVLEISNSLFNPKMAFSPENSLGWMQDIKSMELKERIIKFITDPSQSSEIVEASEFLHPKEYFQDLLVLRGLLAYQVLIHCLKMRHDVDYGVVANHKTLMAIPFRAANLPKLRSEFAQPDCAVAFTVLSYYNIGLTRDQVLETFSSLLSSGPSFQSRVYDEFYKLCAASNKDRAEKLLCIDSVDKLDLSNEVQFDLLYHFYRKNMLVINFWLGNVLFPTATMIFPGKLMASSWNLTDSRKSKFQCGFSGTDDACILLPYPLTYHPSDVPSLVATNGKMLEHLCKKAVFCSVPAYPGEQIENILADLAFEEDVDALIDAGALLSNHPIEKVADLFLGKLVHLQSRFKGVVYYSAEKSSWRIKDMKHRETSLSTSPISESDTFVIYDQSRCRGADMKLRPNAKAFLSIGPGQRKDSLIQAAGRLRQLEFGQTIIAVATPDVEILIRDCVGLKAWQKVTMEHVLCYVLFNSVDAIGNALKHWSSQGLRFLHFVHDPSHVRGEEQCDLDTLYAASDEPQTVSEIVLPKIESLETGDSDLCETSKAVMKVLKERTQILGTDVKINFIINFDECERELEQEREMENEKEKELPIMHPFKEKDWKYCSIFTVDSPGNLNEVVKPMSVAKFLKDFLSEKAKVECSTINWGAANMYLTKNFARPLMEHPPYDDFLRPIRLILYFPQHGEFLALSEREADKIWRCYLERSFTDQSGGPILCGINFLLSEKVGSTVFGDMVSSPGDVSTVSHSALALFNGQSEFCQEDQEALRKSLLISREAVSAASFFCNHRGFCFMLQGSDLEKICNQIFQNLHDLECGYLPTPRRGALKRNMTPTNISQSAKKGKSAQSRMKTRAAAAAEAAKNSVNRVTRSSVSTNKGFVKLEYI